MQLKFTVTLIAVFCTALLALAQTDSIKYTKEFEFKEGIYITVNDFRNNTPRLNSQNFHKYNHAKTNYLSFNDTIYYPDSGLIKSIHACDVFGYSDKLNVYYNVCNKIIQNPANKSERNAFQRIRFRVKFIGQICLMYREDDYTNRGQLGEERGNAAPSQRLLVNFHNWKTRKFSIKNFATLLKTVDESIYNEYMSLSKSGRKKSWFIYLEKANNVHPVYFPVNK